MLWADKRVAINSLRNLSVLGVSAVEGVVNTEAIKRPRDLRIVKLKRIGQNLGNLWKSVDLLLLYGAPNRNRYSFEFMKPLIIVLDCVGLAFRKFNHALNPAVSGSRRK